MKLYIVRHGETNHNKKKIIQGHFDVKLNKNGIKQAKRLAKRLSIINFDYAYSSDLLRVKRTTEEIMKFQNCPVKYMKALRERNLGIFNNQPIKKYYKYLDEHKLIGKIHYRLPGGGESYCAMQKRIINFIDKIYKKHKGKTILLSTHGGLKKVFMMYLNNILLENLVKYPTRFNNAGLSIVQFHKGKKHKIKLENCIKHLEV